jgi:cytochrome c peroxidase
MKVKCTFRTTTLRNISKTAPYMHDGFTATLLTLSVMADTALLTPD